MKFSVSSVQRCCRRGAQRAPERTRRRQDFGGQAGCRRSAFFRLLPASSGFFRLLPPTPHLERFHNTVATRFALRAAVFLAFGCVFARFGFPSPASQVPKRDVRFAQSSQGAAATLPRSSVGFPSLASRFPRYKTCRFAASNAKSQKSSLRTATVLWKGSSLCGKRVWKAKL
jgi:hypothetical protein